MVTKQAYLIRALQSCGKTTLGRKRAKDEGGVCLSFDDFFYTVINRNEPTKFNFKPERIQSAGYWFWMNLKKLVEEEVNPIYVDQIHLWNRHTCLTACFLVHRYGYKLDIVEPEHPLWLETRPYLESDPENRDYNKLIELAQKMSDQSLHGVKIQSVVSYMEAWNDFTVDELLEEC